MVRLQIFRKKTRKHSASFHLINLIYQILEILIKNTNNALKNRNIFVELTDKAKEFVVEKGTDLRNGARPLRRAVQRYIEDTVTDRNI